MGETCTLERNQTGGLSVSCSILEEFLSISLGLSILKCKMRLPQSIVRLDTVGKAPSLPIAGLHE